MPADSEPLMGETESESADGGLRTAVVHNDATPDRRTLYPADVDEDELVTHWLTADEDSFVDLREMR